MVIFIRITTYLFWSKEVARFIDFLNTPEIKVQLGMLQMPIYTKWCHPISENVIIWLSSNNKEYWIILTNNHAEPHAHKNVKGYNEWTCWIDWIIPWLNAHNLCGYRQNLLAQTMDHTHYVQVCHDNPEYPPWGINTLESATNFNTHLHEGK